jgi:hypothetical protein
MLSGRGLQPGKSGGNVKKEELNQKVSSREKGFYGTANGEMREAS